MCFLIFLKTWSVQTNKPFQLIISWHKGLSIKRMFTQHIFSMCLAIPLRVFAQTTVVCFLWDLLARSNVNDFKLALQILIVLKLLLNLMCLIVS